MTRSKRMEPVVKVAGERERTAARQLGDSQRLLDQCETRLAELVAYREDYGQRFQTQGGQGLGARHLHEYRTFLARLNEAIRQQEAMVTQARANLERLREHWMAARTRAKALDKVVERYDAYERRAEEGREQKESDERTLRSTGRKPEED